VPSFKVNLIFLTLTLLENKMLKFHLSMIRLLWQKIIYLWEKNVVINVSFYPIFLKLLMNFPLNLLFILLTLMMC